MQRVLFPLLILLALPAAPALAATGGDLWVHVRVVDDGGDERVTVNLPFRLISRALPMIPDLDIDHHMRDDSVRINGRRFSYSELHDLWAALRNGPDMEYVTVQDDDEEVRIWKEAGYLYVEVRDPWDEDVDVKLPVGVVDALLGSRDELDLEAAIGALAEHGPGELVHVRGDDETVRVWVDDSPDATD